MRSSAFVMRATLAAALEAGERRSAHISPVSRHSPAHRHRAYGSCGLANRAPNGGPAFYILFLSAQIIPCRIIAAARFLFHFHLSHFSISAERAPPPARSQSARGRAATGAQNARKLQREIDGVCHRRRVAMQWAQRNGRNRCKMPRAVSELGDAQMDGKIKMKCENDANAEAASRHSGHCNRARDHEKQLTNASPKENRISCARRQPVTDIVIVRRSPSISLFSTGRAERGAGRETNQLLLLRLFVAAVVINTLF